MDREVHRSNPRGYTKAVDLWSLGCVTAVALVGYVPFDESSTSVSGGLANLDAELKSLDTGPYARDFLRKLLVLDESKRMEVKEALRHAWFTNPAHTRDFEERYRRVIQDWRPRTREEPVIVDLASFTHVDAAHPRSPEFASHSPGRYPRCRSVDHVSESSCDDLAAGDLPPSNLAFHLDPAYNRPSIDARAVLGNSHEPTDCASYGRSARSAANIISPAQTTSTSTHDNNEHQQRRSNQLYHGSYRGIAASNPNTGFQCANPSPKQVDITPSNRMKPYPGRTASGNEPNEEEVYEEVRNPVTGKRQRRIYGREMEVMAKWF